MNHLNLDFNESTTNAEYKALLSYEGVVTLSVAFIFELIPSGVSRGQGFLTFYNFGPTSENEKNKLGSANIKINNLLALSETRGLFSRK